MNALYHNDRFIRNFPTYHAALLEGQRLGGRFWVDTDNRVPTRSEQLLLPEPESERAARRRVKLEAL